MSNRKRQADHTVADILRLRPKWFMAKQLNPTTTETNLKYIHNLMEYGQNHIADAPWLDVFGGPSEDWSFISIIDNQQINKAIQEYRHETKRSTPEPLNAPVLSRLSLISSDALRLALKPSTRQTEDEIANLKYQIENREREIRDMQQRIREYHDGIHSNSKDMFNLEKRIEGLELSMGDDKSQIDPMKLTTLRSIPGQWIVAHVCENSFTIVRRVPLTMKYINANSGMCKTLYLGYCGFTFDWQLNCLDSFNVADYINYSSGRIHPHVSGNHICFGNQNRKAENLRKEMKVKEYFDVIEAVLTTYCPDNPYIAFHNLERARVRKYVALKSDLLGRYAPAWFKTNQAEFMRMFRATASDRFLEWDAARAVAAVPNTIAEKRKKFLNWCKAQRATMLDQANIMNGKLKTIPDGVRGPELVKIFREHGIRIPDKMSLVRTGITSEYDMDTTMLKLMLVAYGDIPLAKGYDGADRYVHVKKDLEFSMREVWGSNDCYFRYWTIKDGERVPESARDSSSFSFYVSEYSASTDTGEPAPSVPATAKSKLLDRLMQDAAVQVTLEDLRASIRNRPAPLIDPEAEVPLDEEEGEQDEEDNSEEDGEQLVSEDENDEPDCIHTFHVNGFCTQCGWYEESHDTVQRRAAEEAVPF